MNTLDRLHNKTFAIQHNPNCPSPFLIRIVGKGAAALDYLSYRETKDALGYGKTLEEAVENVLHVCLQRNIKI